MQISRCSFPPLTTISPLSASGLSPKARKGNFIYEMAMAVYNSRQTEDFSFIGKDVPIDRATRENRPIDYEHQCPKESKVGRDNVVITRVSSLRSHEKHGPLACSHGAAGAMAPNELTGNKGGLLVISQVPGPLLIDSLGYCAGQMSMIKIFVINRYAAANSDSALSRYTSYRYRRSADRRFARRSRTGSAPP